MVTGSCGEIMEDHEGICGILITGDPGGSCRIVWDCALDLFTCHAFHNTTLEPYNGSQWTESGFSWGSLCSPV